MVPTNPLIAVVVFTKDRHVHKDLDLPKVITAYTVLLTGARGEEIRTCCGSSTRNRSYFPAPNHRTDGERDGRYELGLPRLLRTNKRVSVL